MKQKTLQDIFFSELTVFFNMYVYSATAKSLFTFWTSQVANLNRTTLKKTPKLTALA